MIRYSFLLVLIFLYSCSDKKEEIIEIPSISSVEELVEHSEEFNKEVISFETPGGKIHFAIGFGIANSIMVEGSDGNIIIDAADSTYDAEQIYGLFRKKDSKPIKAIIYTHNHGDHTFGAAYYLNTQASKPQIIAHEDTDYYVQRIMGIINPIITKRSSRMFGTFLPEKDLINVGIGPSLNVSKSPNGYLKPDLTFADDLKITISGIEIELYHAPGETNDQLFVWLPKHKSLMPGDNVYKTFPNLYTIRGTTHRDVTGWVDSIDHMIEFQPEYLFPSHTRPVTGSEKIENILITYRDAIQYIHDQTIRLMNLGYYPDQIAEMIKLPSNIAASPFLSEFYGTVRWSVKSIFNGYLGWFNGNPAELDPLSRSEKAKRISQLAGGSSELINQLKIAVNNDDMQWALELSDYLISLDLLTDEVRELRQEALIYEGSRSSNPNKRNYFLASALELNKSFEFSPLLNINDSILENISIHTLFDVMSVRFNPNNHDSSLYKVCFNFTSGHSKIITLRNDVAVISDSNQEDCDLEIETEEIELKRILTGLKSPVSSIATGSIEISGGNTNFLKFLTLFR